MPCFVIILIKDVDNVSYCYLETFFFSLVSTILIGEYELKKTRGWGLRPLLTPPPYKGIPTVLLTNNGPCYYSGTVLEALKVYPKAVW